MSTRKAMRLMMSNRGAHTQDVDTPTRLLCLASLVLVASLLAFVDPVIASANVAAPVPGALWTVPMPTAGSPVVTPTGDVLAGPCTNVNRNGAVVWSLPDNLEIQARAGCATAIGDNQGNSYIQTTDSTGRIVESINPSGGVRWTTSMGLFGPGGGPAIGSNGSVYFSEYNGSGSKVVGFDEQTGAVMFDRSFVQVTGLYAYTGGIIVVNTDSEVDYFSYDGSSEITYHASPAISAGQAYSSAAGANGTVFLAGYSESCGGNVSVAKFTPTGPAWTWTDNTPHSCSGTFLAATPDGGVILARSEATSGLSADFTSVSPTGTFRWDHHANGPLGPAYAGGRPIVDVNGLVALPSLFESTCPEAGQCKGAQVEFVSQQANSLALPTVEVTDPVNGGFDLYLYGSAIDSERVYLSREYQGPTVPPSLSAFAVPGLGGDYRLALQEALLPVAPVPPPSGGNTTGGGSSPGSGGGAAPPHASGTGIYVALGDSYSSGEGVPPYLPQPKGDGCDRSALAWPFLVNIDLGFYRPRFSFHACSGALVQSLTKFNKNSNELSQEHWLSSSTQLVTLTWGGDNANFPKVITTCVLQQECQVYWQLAVNRAIAQMRGTSNTDPVSLVRLYETISRRAPNAKIIVLGYPRFFPPKPPATCLTGFGFKFGHAEMMWINNEINSMDNTISGAVAIAEHHGYQHVQYVRDSYDAFSGHELCTKAPYYNAVVPSHIYTSFHPNITGNQRLAQLVVARYGN